MTRSWWFAALLSVLLHLLVAVPLILRPSWLLDTPEPPPPVYATVDLVVQDTPTVGEGAGRPVLHDTAPTPAPPVATPLLPPTPDPSAEPVPVPPSVAAQPAPPVPAEPPKDPGPPPAIRLGDGDDAGTGIVTGPGVIPAKPDEAVQNKPPPYPALAAKLGQEGTVSLVIHIDTQGRPGTIDLAESSGWPLLDSAALEAVKRWRFHPAQQDGVPVPSTFPIHMRFRTDENTP